MKIVFFGTPDFAVGSLEKIVMSTHEVVGVVTSTDKKVGRNRSQLSTSAVKKFAIEHDLLILQPKSLKNKAFLNKLRNLNADVFVVVAFRMMPKELWSLPPRGTFNLHASLLPAYRGAAPINWAIIKGEKETGVTTFFIDEKIDTGNIIIQKRAQIGPDEEAGSLYNRLKDIGSEIVVDTLNLIESGSIKTTPQDESLASPAPKIFHHDCMIDSRMAVQDAYNHIRGVNPYPGAWFYFHFKEMKVIDYEMILDHSSFDTFVQTDYKSYLHLHFNGGYIDIINCKYAGKKEMSVKDFFNGFKKP